MPIDQAWLDQVQEEVIEPDRPIIDPHHHLWDYPGSRYLLDELLSDMGSGHNVVATVFVECGAMYRADGPEHLKPVGETEFVNGVAAMSASGTYGAARACAGIVGLADLNLGSRVGEVLDAHMRAAPDRFRGIRHVAAHDDSPDVRVAHTKPFRHMLADATFREGFAELQKRDMSFEAWVYHPQIREVTELARAFPDTVIIADHFLGPLGIGPYEGKRDEIFEQWKLDFAELARCENVVAKLGGLNMAVNGFGWHKRDKPPTARELVAATGDWYVHAIDCFGPGRCMFESNFPVDKLSVSYPVLWNAFKLIAAAYTEAERDALFHDTAKRVYRLDLPD
ncbi:amidohydrolase family protein [Minwuia thermotolerans]|uniref:Amidohydrolase n=1 Tax=Minwuia thermotolerans TaxID=2056226 RepID=A0A2M9FWV9_9PROT|nr:amidohydrolase family protein [Minwuia thermotolerans]PJK27946.1 amidohydrolase [Minwuia thermotolerans]